MVPRAYSGRELRKITNTFRANNSVKTMTKSIMFREGIGSMFFKKRGGLDDVKEGFEMIKTWFT